MARSPVLLFPPPTPGRPPAHGPGRASPTTAPHWSRPRRSGTGRDPRFRHGQLSLRAGGAMVDRLRPQARSARPASPCDPGRRTGGTTTHMPTPSRGAAPRCGGLRIPALPDRAPQPRARRATPDRRASLRRAHAGRRSAPGQRRLRGFPEPLERCGLPRPACGITCGQGASSGCPRRRPVVLS